MVVPSRRGCRDGTPPREVHTPTLVLDRNLRSVCFNTLRAYVPSGEHREDEVQEERQPIPLDAIRRIQLDCIAIDDEMRWLLAIISDTGMRLSEAAGLHRDDIILDVSIPYINLQPHSWRRLEIIGSARHIRLIGASLWAAKRLHRNDSSYDFPRYCDGKICNANSASAALNKWLKPRVSGHAVVHSLRHSMRDRLRAVECPSDIIDQ